MSLVGKIEFFSVSLTLKDVMGIGRSCWDLACQANHRVKIKQEESVQRINVVFMVEQKCENQQNAKIGQNTKGKISTHRLS